MTAFFSFIIDKKHSLCYHIDILLKIQLPIKREKKYERIVIYDYPFSTPTKNAVNKRIIERPIFFPRLRLGKNIRQEP